ncbi:hypothetical protein HDU76_008549 [Blyttiomyces sp. JEL0837]|nr:hypothetical protein HDU76_008549 [Blyttiomyces sp. JEL0837]
MRRNPTLVESSSESSIPDSFQKMLNSVSALSYQHHTPLSSASTLSERPDIPHSHLSKSFDHIDAVMANINVASMESPTTTDILLSNGNGNAHSGPQGTVWVVGPAVGTSGRVPAVQGKPNSTVAAAAEALGGAMTPRLASSFLSSTVLPKESGIGKLSISLPPQQRRRGPLPTSVTLSTTPQPPIVEPVIVTSVIKSSQPRSRASNGSPVREREPIQDVNRKWDEMMRRTSVTEGGVRTVTSVGQLGNDEDDKFERTRRNISFCDKVMCRSISIVSLEATQDPSPGVQNNNSQNDDSDEDENDTLCSNESDDEEVVWDDDMPEVQNSWPDPEPTNTTTSTSSSIGSFSTALNSSVSSAAKSLIVSPEPRRHTLDPPVQSPQLEEGKSSVSSPSRRIISKSHEETNSANLQQFSQQHNSTSSTAAAKDTTPPLLHSKPSSASQSHLSQQQPTPLNQNFTVDQVTPFDTSGSSPKVLSYPSSPKSSYHRRDKGPVSAELVASALRQHTQTQTQTHNQPTAYERLTNRGSNQNLGDEPDNDRRWLAPAPQTRSVDDINRDNITVGEDDMINKGNGKKMAQSRHSQGMASRGPHPAGSDATLTVEEPDDAAPVDFVISGDKYDRSNISNDYENRDITLKQPGSGQIPYGSNSETSLHQELEAGYMTEESESDPLQSSQSKPRKISTAQPFVVVVAPAPPTSSSHSSKPNGKTSNAWATPSAGAQPVQQQSQQFNTAIQHQQQHQSQPSSPAYKANPAPSPPPPSSASTSPTVSPRSSIISGVGLMSTTMKSSSIDAGANNLNQNKGYSSLNNNASESSLYAQSKVPVVVVKIPTSTTERSSANRTSTKPSTLMRTQSYPASETGLLQDSVNGKKSSPRSSVTIADNTTRNSPSPYRRTSSFAGRQARQDASRFSIEQTRAKTQSRGALADKSWSVKNDDSTAEPTLKSTSASTPNTQIKHSRSSSLIKAYGSGDPNACLNTSTASASTSGIIPNGSNGNLNNLSSNNGTIASSTASRASTPGDPSQPPPTRQPRRSLSTAMGNFASSFAHSLAGTSGRSSRLSNVITPESGLFNGGLDATSGGGASTGDVIAGGSKNGSTGDITNRSNNNMSKTASNDRISIKSGLLGLIGGGGAHFGSSGTLGGRPHSSHEGVIVHELVELHEVENVELPGTPSQRRPRKASLANLTEGSSEGHNGGNAPMFEKRPSFISKPFEALQVFFSKVVDAMRGRFSSSWRSKPKEK